MTDNEKRQLWQAGLLCDVDESQVVYNTPDYLNDDAEADALSLIPFLVKEKGYSVSLDYIEGKGWWFEASLDGYRCGVQSSFQDTLAKAVVEVVLVLIEKEEQT